MGRSWPAAASRGWGTEVEPEPEREPEVEPEPEREQQADASPREPEPLWTPDPLWRDRPDATQVLPPGWADGPSPGAGEPHRPLQPAVGPIRVTLADDQTPAPELLPDEVPSTAEQAVPWLIGLILLLAGMVIVLMALIFLGEGSLGGFAAEPSGSAQGLLASSSAGPSATATAASTPAAAGPSVAPTPTPMALPEFGPLEMIFQGRSAALAPIYLLHDDFTTVDPAVVLAQDAAFDVHRFAWAPDGTAGAGLLGDVLVSIEPDAEKRNLGGGISTMTFGDDVSTVYAVRVTEDGANDVATILAIDFLTGDTTELGSVSYARPAAAENEPLVDAQWVDDGGPVRIYWLETDVLRLWVIGAGMWDVDPAGGQVSALPPETPEPTLWAPDGEQRVTLEVVEGVTTIRLLDAEDEEVISVSIQGLLSHLRWSPKGERIVFTAGTLAPNGGIIQDLYLWDINDQPIMKLTTSGANFGAEWRGSQPRWRG